MTEALKVLYLGNDLFYFKHIKEQMPLIIGQSEYFQFKIVQKDIYKVLLNVIEHKPAICFIDYTDFPDDMLGVARNMARCHPCIIIGLCKLGETSRIINESITTGPRLCYFKNLSNNTPFYHISMLLKGPDAKPPGEALAKVNNTILDCNYFVKVGFIGNEYIRIEHDFPLPEMFDLNFYFLPKNPIVNCSPISSVNDIYYGKNFASNIKLFVKPPPKKPKDEAERKFLEEKEKYDNEDIENSKYLLNKFIEKNYQNTTELGKIAKIVLIDEKLEFLKDLAKPVDGYEFSFKFFSEFKKAELDKINPGFIIYSFKNEEEFKEVVAYSQNKFFLLLNSHISSEDLKKFHGHLNALSINKISTEKLMDLCKLFKNKNEKQRSDSKLVYVRKDMKSSAGKIALKIEVKEISEEHMIFETETMLGDYAVLNFEMPDVGKFKVTVIPNKENKKNGKKYQYIGVIHTIHEDVVVKLRLHIREILCDPLRQDKRDLNYENKQLREHQQNKFKAEKELEDKERQEKEATEKK
ncbi:MAG: hypothetical protein U0T83_05970 [Bacteriovoracaceae bacterium]